MEYVLRVLFSGLLFILSGFMFGTAFWSYRERKHREKQDETETALAEPESYIWVKVEDHLPTREVECVVEYCFDGRGFKFYDVLRFYPREGRFQCEGYQGMKVVRWAELPR